MGVRLDGLEALKKRLQNMTIKGANTVRAGVIGAGTYPNGMSIVAVAAINEFGGTITIPERKATLYFKETNGNVGNRFVKKDKSNFAQDVNIGETTINIPSRPFLRNTFHEKKKEWSSLLRQLLLNGTDADKALHILGVTMENNIVAYLNKARQGNAEGIAPNAPSTRKRKPPSNGPLFDSGVLIKSITFEVE